MEPIDSSQDTGPKRWAVTMTGGRKTTVVTAHAVYLNGGALVFRSGDGQLVIAFGPQAWDRLETAQDEPKGFTRA
jgi:hypothetical protein